MPSFATLVPTATEFNTGWTITGAASAWQALASSSEADYVDSPNPWATNRLRLTMSTETPPADHERHSVRMTVLVEMPVANSFGYFQSFWFTADSPSFNDTAQRFNSEDGDWHVMGTSFKSSDLYLFPTAPMLFRAEIQAISPAPTMRAHYLFMTVDRRAKPTFTADVLDAAGASASGGTITDTNRPRFNFSTPVYDGLNPRNWTLTVLNNDTGGVEYFTEGSGAPPSTLIGPAINNGNFTASFQVFSTIRVNSPFASDLEEIDFEMDFIAPVAPTLAVTLNGCTSDAPHVQVCWTEPTPGATEFDSEPAIEIVRSDCQGQRTIFVEALSFTGCTCDHTMSINDEGFYCGLEAPQGMRLVGNGLGVGSARARMLDSVPISITGDLEVEFDLALQEWQTSKAPARLMTKPSSYAVDYGNWDGGTSRLIFVWITATTTFAARATEPLPFDPGERGQVKITFDQNNGAGASTTRFYYDRGDGYVQLGDPVTLGTAQAIADSTGELGVGGLGSGDHFGQTGHIFSMTLRSGIGGTIVASPDFSDPAEWTIGEDNGDTATDGQGNSWLLTGTNTALIAEAACLVSYQARYWGLVDTVPVASDWAYASAVVVENPTPGNDWIYGNGSALSVCTDRSYTRSRPFGAFQPIGGGIPTVITGLPGGRDYTVEFTLASEAELVALEDVLAAPVQFFHPVSQADLWMSVNPESVQVLKLKQRRILTATFTAVNPQPIVDPVSLLT